MRYRKYFLLPFCLFLLLVPLSESYAASKRAYAEVEPNSGTQDDSFTLRLVIENGEVDSTPELSANDNFEVQAAGTESGMTLINGAVSMRRSYLFVLTPKKTGLLETPKAFVEVDGEKLEIESRKIQVLASGQNSLGTNQGSTNSSQVFMTQRVDKKQAFVGEQIVNTVELYASVSVADIEPLSSAPNTVWQELIEAEHSGRKVIDGEHFKTIDVSYALFPLKEGELILEPRTRKLKVQGRSRRSPGLSLDPFDDPFFGAIANFRPTTVRTEPLNLQIKPLPPKPNQFYDWGASSVVVGKTELAVSFDPSDIEVGQSKTLEFKLTSLGNINPIKNVPIAENAAYKIYRDAAQSKNFANANSLVSQTVFSLSIVPSRPGFVDLGEISLSYFDPENSMYQNARSKRIHFTVTGSATSDPDTSRQREPAQSEITQSTPVTSPTPAKSQVSESSFMQEARFWLRSNVGTTLAAFAAALILGIFSIVYLLMKFQRANSQRQKRLEQVVAANSVSELDKALREYLSFQLGLAPIADRQTILTSLNTEVSEASLALNTQLILDKLEQWQFSLNKPAHEDVQNLKNQILDLINSF